MGNKHIAEYKPGDTMPNGNTYLAARGTQDKWVVLSVCGGYEPFVVHNCNAIAETSSGRYFKSIEEAVKSLKERR
ncbi:hypothetical protein ES703_39890 [subsurface metagenome]